MLRENERKKFILVKIVLDLENEVIAVIIDLIKEYKIFGIIVINIIINCEKLIIKIFLVIGKFIIEEVGGISGKLLIKRLIEIIKFIW